MSTSKQAAGGQLDTGLSSTTKPADTIIDQILYEHTKVKALYTQLQASTDEEERQMLCWEITREVCIHSGKEEMVLYPAMAELLSTDQAEHCLQEHVTVKQLLAAVDGMKVSEPQAVENFDKAMKALLAHMEEEETKWLPQMEKASTPAKLRELAIKYHSAALAAPTRPHPEAPNKPPENMVNNPMMLMKDLEADLQRFGGVAHTTTAITV